MIKTICFHLLWILGLYEFFINGNKELGLLWVLLAHVATQSPVEIKFVGKNNKVES